MNRRLLLVSALCVGLSACALPWPATPEPAIPATVPPAKPPPPDEGRAPARTHAARTTSPARANKAPERRNAVTPDELIGLDEAGVRSLLGDPGEARSEGVARILSYRGKGSCALDVIFFMDVKAGGLRVLSYRMKDAQSRAADRACYVALRRSR